MSPEVIEALMALEGAVVTRTSGNSRQVRIIAVSDTATFSIVLSGCEWDDQRCEKCSCDPDRVTVKVERVP